MLDNNYLAQGWPRCPFLGTLREKKEPSLVHTPHTPLVVQVSLSGSTTTTLA